MLWKVSEVRTSRLKCDRSDPPVNLRTALDRCAVVQMDKDPPSITCALGLQGANEIKGVGKEDGH